MTVLEEILNFNKHILITGKSELERYHYLNGILLQANLETIRFPKPLNSIDQYLETVEKHQLFQPSFPSRKKYNSNQLYDYHIDWITCNKALLVLEEIQELEENWKTELLQTFTINLETNKKSATRLIITMDYENGILQNLLTEIEEINNKTSNQIIDSNFLVIEI